MFPKAGFSLDGVSAETTVEPHEIRVVDDRSEVHSSIEISFFLLQRPAASHRGVEFDC